MSLRVEQVYGHATVQGAPVNGRRRFGVPPGGAFDPPLQERLNTTLGNPLTAPVLELALCRLTLKALENVMLVWGGSSTVSLDGLNVLSFQMGHVVRAGSVVVFDVPQFGAREWVAASGGFRINSSDVIKRGDILEVDPRTRPPVAISTVGHGLGPPGGYIRAMPGRREFGQLFKNRYTVRHDSDRVGIRLEGPRMAHSLELPSEPATPGVVQITPEGLPIILGPDGPTIGGYPRAAVVISADLPALSQLRPGAEIRFARSSLATAGELAAAAARLHESVLNAHG